jgi:hypothetical protein
MDEIFRLQDSIQVVLVSYPEGVILRVNCDLGGECKNGLQSDGSSDLADFVYCRCLP